MSTDDQNNKDLELGALESSYHEAETCDMDVFGEMRSNILLMSGQHYRKTVGRRLERGLRDIGVAKSKRIRLVKNHTQKAINDAKDIVASMVPGVMPYPTVEGELKHQKSAEIARQVWNHSKECNRWDEFREECIDNFFEIGEVCAKVYFNPLKGGLRGFKQKVNDLGEPLYKTPDGEITTQKGYYEKSFEAILVDGVPVQREVQGEFVAYEMCPDEDRPEFYGQVVLERFEAYDLLRDKSSKDVNKSPWLIYRKMISNDTLKALIRRSSVMSDSQKEEAIEKLGTGGGSTFKVFNAGNGSFEEAEGQTLLKEKYWRQSPKYPKGYFCIWTEYGKLFEGPIPFGEYGDIAFPIKWQGFDRFSSSARGFSPIKRVRPAQLEVNRCASKITEHHLTVGDDKVILQKGSKFERGVDHPGIRVFYSTGQAQYLQGKSGEQFVGYLDHNIAEIYRLLSVEDNKSPTAQGFDPKAELFKMQRQKIKFSKPAGKLERFFKDVAQTYLFLEQKYMTPERFERVVGPQEAVNFNEFESIDRLDYKVKLEEVSGDLETMMGKTMELETILQYSGKDLDEQTRISLLRQFPILNRQQAFKHVTIQHDNIESDILALERGEYVPPREYDNHELVLQFLSNRMSQKDFGKLDPQIQEMFKKKEQEHQMFLKQQIEELRKAQAGLIPTTGPLVRADVYVADDPSKPDKTSRMEVPNDALMWLRENLEKQGIAQERLQELKDLGMKAEIMGGLGEPQEEEMLPPMLPPEPTM